MNILPVGIESSSVASANRPPAPSVSDKTSSQALAAPKARAAEIPDEPTANASVQELAEKTEQAVEKISRFVEYAASDLQFTVDEESEVPVVKVIDRATKEVIRQIPSQEAIEISRALDKLNGLLIKNQA